MLPRADRPDGDAPVGAGARQCEETTLYSRSHFARPPSRLTFRHVHMTAAKLHALAGWHALVVRIHGLAQ